MRIALSLLGTELLAVEWGTSVVVQAVQASDEQNHAGDFTIGFTGPPTSQPLPSDVEARR